eukprot:scaffold7325_cov120-Isochrysis_galbana.AAC.1
MGGTAHQPSRPPMAAQCQPLPSTHLSGTHPRTIRYCRRVPCRKARLRCGRGQVRVVWRRACRERLAPGLVCCRSVGRS